MITRAMLAATSSVAFDIYRFQKLTSPRISPSPHLFFVPFSFIFSKHMPIKSICVLLYIYILHEYMCYMVAWDRFYGDKTHRFFWNKNKIHWQWGRHALCVYIFYARVCGSRSPGHHFVECDGAAAVRWQPHRWSHRRNVVKRKIFLENIGNSSVASEIVKTAPNRSEQ